MTRTKQTTDRGHINVRISKAAHQAIVKEAMKNRRTFVATLDLIMGV